MEQRRTILIVDGDPRICRLIQRYLEQEGYRVFTATSSEEMEQKLTKVRVDLVLLDVRLADRDGFAFLGSIPNLAVVMVMHRRDARSEALGLETAAGVYVTKPFDEREILARIRTAFRRQSLATRAPHNATES